MRIGVWAVLLLGLGGCATLTEGTSQVLSIDSDPQGARCELFRDGGNIGSATTPGAVTVGKSRKDITITCKKAGYEEGSGVIKADLAVAYVGNVLIGGAVGLMVDAASGAAAKYDKLTFVSLTPQPGQISAPAEATTATLSAPTLAPTPLPAIAPGIFAAPIGSEYQGAVDLGMVQMPLLEGTWTLAGKGIQAPTERAASLVRIQDGRLWGIIRVWTNARPVNRGYGLFRPCGRGDVLFVSVASNADHDGQDCWLVNHYDMEKARATSTQQHMLDSYAFLDNRGIKVPGTMIVGMHRIATRTNFITIWYQVNPEFAGFPPPATVAWRESEWHRDRIALDPNRVAYVESFKESHARYQDLLRRGFQRALASATIPSAE